MVKFFQERFLFDKTQISNSTYWVPITYTTDSEANFENVATKFFLKNESVEIVLKLKPQWFIVNLQEVGYYRVNYDLPSWLKLINILNSDKYELIPPINRAQIVDDVLNLASAGYLEFGLAFKAAHYLVRENSYLPWQAFFNTISRLHYRLVGYDDVKVDFESAIVNLLSRAYHGIDKGDDHLDLLKKELLTIWGCKFGHKKCIDSSKQLFAHWKADNAKK